MILSKKFVFEETAFQNNSTFFALSEWLYRLATSRFKWQNTPKTWDIEFLEDVLYFEGVIACVYSENYGLILSRCCTNGKYNHYDLPTSIRLAGENLPPEMMSKLYQVYNSNILPTDNKNDIAVLIKNNSLMRPTRDLIDRLFTYRLYETQRAMDVNTKQQKTPGFLAGTDKQRLTLLNLYKQYDGNEPFIFADKEFLSNGELLRYISTPAPFLLDKLSMAKHELWNEALSFLGINNVNISKKERLITEEANANNHFTELNAEPEIISRKKACKEINACFGENITVELKKSDEIVEKNVERVEKNE